MASARAFVMTEPAVIGRDGYPPEWHQTIKHEVREQAGHRCVRCGHPYRNGEHGNGEWSPCDTKCTHRGPVRLDGTPRELVYFTAGGCVRYGRTVEARWRILTVHHLDGDKTNCRWWNLAALCQVCHLSVQGRVKMAQVYPFEHTEWFRPYAAGYYAWVYLREDLTRDEVDSRLDELLALERQASLMGEGDR